MSRIRLLLLVAGLIVILGLAIGLIDSITKLLAQLAAYPLLAQGVLALVVALLAVLVGMLVYYLMIVPRRSRQSTQRNDLPPPPILVANKTEATTETLYAVDRQAEQLHDEIARQALLQRTQELQANLARGAIQIVVFGTGSAGKTSIANAILGRPVGEVGAPMGTTQIRQTYRLNLEGITRELHLIDTPGILEVGVAGTERERQARQLATEADLLIFVVDNDLRQSEYEPLHALAQIGKRSLLVLNKADLYTDTDCAAILERLQSRVQGLIAPEDVLAIAANPQAVQLQTGEWLQPDLYVLPLIERVVAVLRTEGEELLADNLLLQSQRLAKDARQLLDAQRTDQADRIIDRFQWIGAGVVAATPLPLIDMLATAAINAQMVVEIGKVYGCHLTSESAKELAASLARTLTGLGIVKGAIALLATALQISLGGLVVGRALQAATAAYLTRIAGKAFVEYFRNDQDWGDGGITEAVRRQFQLNRRDEFIKAFVQDALTRVINPLHLNRPSTPTASQAPVVSPPISFTAQLESEPIQFHPEEQ